MAPDETNIGSEIAPATAAAIEEMYANQNRFRPARKRAEILRTLPVVFVVLLIIFIYTVYVAFHLIPLLQLNIDFDSRDQGMFVRGIVEVVTFHCFFVLFLIGYILSIITPPGTIPNTSEWTTFGGEKYLMYNVLETKREGQRRYCKWCTKYKPDRSHHCRQCRRCVLKMDHHCPWIHNCVGWGNHKYFVLTLIYSTLSTLFVVGTQVESVKTAIEEPQIRFGIFMLLLLSEVCTGLLGLICISFLGFHLWLIVHNLSTIEFCEKHFRRNPEQNIYNRGCCKNLEDAFGRNPFLWLLPVGMFRMMGNKCLDSGRHKILISVPKSHLFPSLASHSRMPIIGLEMGSILKQIQRQPSCSHAILPAVVPACYLAEFISKKLLEFTTKIFRGAHWFEDTSPVCLIGLRNHRVET